MTDHRKIEDFKGPMRRIAALLLVLAVALPIPGAVGHVDALRDPKNNTEVDVRRAWLDHTDNKLKGRIRTRQHISNSLLRNRGFFRFHFWEPGKRDEGVFAVAIFRKDGDLKARLFKIKKSGVKQLGFGSARREGPDEFSFG